MFHRATLHDAFQGYKMRTAKETIPDYLSAFPCRLVIFGGAKLCCFLNRND